MQMNPFFAAQQPVITLTHRLGGEHLRVGTTLRFGHGKAGNDIAIEQRLQVALLLRGGAVMGENFAVAGIRCLAAKDDTTKQRAASSSLIKRKAHLGHTLPPPSSGPR